MTEPQLDSNTNNNSVRNIVIAITAVVLSIALFLGLQTETSSLSLESQVKRSTPLNVALTNNKPTLTEFYADWCTSCQAMAADLGAIKQNYGDRVNFVMLNVDNTKWLPEMLRYRVDGIPHFLFMDSTGEAVAEAIGEQPRSILQEDLDALIANNPIPYANTRGQVSQFEKKVTVTDNANTDPRSHGATVK
ncbi:thioredoxin family protein [Pleurocapsa sp. PCC 7319]|uniref:thioredoxin family protein n=1 Tax=Pleurocapsa sp. PCC 7319 TaxID=118161 RepID=UPI00034DB450|nr:thioredoxin family protein [Pleurocapsa sp. PCC 7319]